MRVSHAIAALKSEALCIGTNSGAERSSVLARRKTRRHPFGVPIPRSVVVDSPLMTNF
jgi:hypothetical protein